MISMGTRLITYNSQFYNKHESNTQWKPYAIVHNEKSHSWYLLFARAQEKALGHTLEWNGEKHHVWQTGLAFGIILQINFVLRNRI